MMKHYFLLTLLGLSTLTQAVELTSYQAIEQTLNQGKLVTFVFKARLCAVQNPNADTFKPKTDTAIFKPQTVLMSEAEGALGVAGDWLTTAIPSHEKMGVSQHYHMILNNQKQARISVEFFNPETRQRLDDLKPIVAMCELGKGIKAYD